MLMLKHIHIYFSVKRILPLYKYEPRTTPYYLKDENDPSYGPYINTVQNADRFFHFIRSNNELPPYLLVADDIQKDASPHEYRWRVYTTTVCQNITFNNPIVVPGNQNSSF